MSFEDQLLFCKTQIHSNAQLVVDIMYNCLKIKGTFSNRKTVKYWRYQDNRRQGI